jgi:hypothetical protein
VQDAACVFNCWCVVIEDFVVIDDCWLLVYIVVPGGF